ncbi:MAG: hypothetical protein OXH04_06980 [Acidobacteria bacterium]|nr:hypothetical protein [Acidobacteriota bacterium]
MKRDAPCTAAKPPAAGPSASPAFSGCRSFRVTRDAVEAITESNTAIDRALEAISSAQKALSRSNTAIARAIQERQNA